MPLASASRHELESEVQRSIDRLSPKLRSVTVLRYIESLSYEQISEVLSISLGTVKSRLARAHEALDRDLSPVLHKHYLG
jgi:RNA polymerase sigma-70 factor (ECF subfamily)